MSKDAEKIGITRQNKMPWDANGLTIADCFLNESYYSNSFKLRELRDLRLRDI